MIIRITAVILAIVLAGQVYAQSVSTNKFRSTIAKKPGTLTDEEIAGLKETYVNERTKTKYAFSASFLKITPGDKDKSKYVKSGKIPFKMYAALYEIKESVGKQVRKRQNGTANIFIQDSDGNVVLTKFMSMEKMCPS